MEIEKWIEDSENFIPPDVIVTHNLHLKTRLLPHQSIDVEAMIAIEKYQTYGYGSKKQGRKPVIKAGVLSEPFGSGKTLIVLALINSAHIPKNKEILPISNDYYYINKVITRSFHRIIKPTIVLCGSNVLIQWAENVKKHTYMNCYTISNVKQIRALPALIRSGEIDKYDMILVKNSTITTSINIDGFVDPNIKVSKPYMQDCIRNIMVNEGVGCPRVVYDDFDILELEKRAPIPTLFTWLVSATHDHYYGKHIDIKYSSKIPLSTILDQAYYGSSHIRSGNLLWKKVKVCCDPEFTSNCINTGKLTFFKYDFKSNITAFANMIEELSGKKEVKNMILGDAMTSAANEVGASTANVGSIFRIILREFYEEWYRLKMQLDFLNKIMNAGLQTNPAYEYDMTSVESMVFPSYINDQISNDIKELHKKITQQKDKAGRSLDRVKSNLQTMECSICVNVLSGDKAVIFCCCGIVTCSYCCVNGCNFTNLQNPKGRCMFCRREIDTSDLVLVSDTNLLSIIDEKCDTSYIHIKPPLTKIEVIIELVKTHSTSYDRIEDCDPIQVPNILAGIIDLPKPLDCERRYLICSEYEETTIAAYDAIKTEGLPVARLIGTPERQKIILDSFRSGEKTILIIDKDHVAGLDLSYVTDLIFMQTMDNTELARQLIGRIQRYGRTNSGTVHLLSYVKPKEEPYP